jgi:hypothetical protein
MSYKPLPRPETTPDMRERARALLGAAQRRQNLYAQALVQAEFNPGDGVPPGHGAMVGAPQPLPEDGSTLESLVQHVTQASDHDLISTHQRLAQARSTAQQLAAADSELQAFMSAAYGAAPALGASAAKGATPAPNAAMQAGEVVDVQVREVRTDPEPPSAG